MEIDRVLFFQQEEDGPWTLAFCNGRFKTREEAMVAAHIIMQKQAFLLARFGEEYAKIQEENQPPPTMFDTILQGIQEEIERSK